MNSTFKAKADDSFEFDFKKSDAENLDILQQSNSKYHLVNGSQSIGVVCEKADFNNKKYVIKINGNRYPVQISNSLDIQIKEMGFSLGAAKKANDIKAPMPGIILSVSVKEGQEVKEGDTLLILEAMKMENAIGAPKDGIIKFIHQNGNSAVEKGALLIEME